MSDEIAKKINQDYLNLSEEEKKKHAWLLINDNGIINTSNPDAVIIEVDKNNLIDLVKRLVHKLTEKQYEN